MNPITAVCFIMAGFSLTSCNLYPDIKEWRSVTQFTAIALSIICTIHLLSFARIVPIQIDLILFKERIAQDTLGNVSSRMAFNTSVCFMLLAFGILGSSVKGRFHSIIANYSALTVILLSFFSIIGYVYRVKEFRDILARFPMAPHTALGFVFASLSVLLLNSRRNIMSIITSPYYGGVIARILIPAALAFPVVLGFIRLNSLWSHIMSIELGTALLITCTSILLFIIIVYVSHKININDNDRRETEEKFKSILESAPDGIVIINADGEIQLTNKQTETLFNYSKDDLLNKKVEVLLPKRFQEGHLAHRMNFFSSPKFREMGAGLELYAKKKDGSEFPVEISLSPIKTKSGVLVSAAIRDITQRKKSAQQFKDLLESAPDAMVIANKSGTIQFVNKQTENIFGYSRASLIGKQVEILIPDEFHGIHPNHRAIFFKNPQTRSMGSGLELYGRRESGQKFPVEISLSPLETEDGILVSAAIRDITERKESDKKLNQLAAIVESTDDPVISQDLNGVIISWNQGAEKLFEYSATEVIGKHITLITPDDRREEENDIHSNISKGVVIKHYETIRVTKSGKQVDVSLTVSPVRDTTGNVIGASQISRDVTERKIVENKLRSLNKELEAFTYSVSHDLRAPLRAIDGYAKILSEDYANELDDEGRTVIAAITRNALRMGSLIDDLLQLSRAGRIDMSSASINMRDVVLRVVDELGALEPARKIEFAIQELQRVRGDVNLIRQVWMNLISNAIKYTRKTEVARIEITSTVDSKEVTYRIADNGAGFDNHYVHKLFRVFQRLHKMNEFEGTGVGLAIIKRIVERHGGRVWADGEVGKGASFYFSLPNN
jgi:PAS domain S-box-containing protein